MQQRPAATASTSADIVVISSALPCKVPSMIRTCLWLTLLAAAFSCSTTAIAQQTNAATSSPVTAAADTTALLRYVPDEIVVAVAIRPHQLLTADGVQKVLQASEAADLPQLLSQYTASTLGLDPLKIADLLLVLDKPTAQLRLSQNGSSQLVENEYMQMQAIGAAMTAFYDEHGFFPAADGFGKSRGRLSWRVHLLPYLEQQELYSQFHLEEPWDSEHNKTLIEKMPQAFQVPGTADAGKTSIHVLVGEGLLFSSNEPPKIESITDQPESTILSVLAEPGTAEVWTKPGGLQTDMTNPVRSFAAARPMIKACMVDGSVASLNTYATPDHWRWLIRHNDGHWSLPIPWLPEQARVPPALLVRFTEKIDQQKILTAILGSLQATEVQVADQRGYRINAMSTAVFPDDRTMLISSEDSLKLMLAPRAAASRLRQQLEKEIATADLVAVGDLTRLPSRSSTAEDQKQPAVADALPRERFTLRLDVTGASKNILTLNIVFANDDKAEQFFELMQEFSSVTQRASPELSEAETPEKTSLLELVQKLWSRDIVRQDNEVRLQIARPASLNPPPVAIQPILKAIVNEFRNPEMPEPQAPLADVAQALSAFHDLNGCFPNWKKFKGSTAGLSWRVHLLQVLDPDLYIRFHMDEPWDSPHNRTLISEMPAAFRTPGVNEPGKTSLHVFLGPNTICGADDTYSADDLSATVQNLLAFVAGPETAEIWTKPAGLKYDAADPIKSLGQFGETLQAVGTNGKVVQLERTIDPSELRGLIERQQTD
jgi:hypothetical protein